MYRSLLFALIVATAGCRIVASNEVKLPIDGPTYLVRCRYEFRNCEREAEHQCSGRFEQLTRKNCPRCDRKLGLPPSPEKNAVVQQPGYGGAMYYRCR